MTINRLPFSLVTGFALCSISFAGAESTSQTPKKPVTDEYQGVKVDDPYQWLEDDHNPDVIEWSDEQNQRTRAYFD
jgi:prolyl oligopeptidase